jgi:hypothetical protein
VLTPEVLNMAKVLHEARIAFCWGRDYVGKRDPWPDFGDPKVLRSYPHNPIPYVDIAVAQAEALLAAQRRPRQSSTVMVEVHRNDGSMVPVEMLRGPT